MKSGRLFLYHVLSLFIPETRGFGLKAALLRWCGAVVGTNVRINSSVRFVGTGRLVVGDDVWLGYGVYLSPVGDAQIEIGAHCDLAPQAMVLTGSHELDPAGEHVAGKGTAASVSIGAGSWLGARCVVLPGVDLPPKTVVAAGAVVTQAPGQEKTVLAGVPAVAKKVLD